MTPKIVSIVCFMFKCAKFNLSICLFFRKVMSLSQKVSTKVLINIGSVFQSINITNIVNALDYIEQLIRVPDTFFPSRKQCDTCNNIGRIYLFDRATPKTWLTMASCPINSE